MPATEKKDEGREMAAGILDGAAATAAFIAAGLPEPFGSIVKAAGGIAGMVGKLIRSVGTDNASELIGELQARVDEGKITDEHVVRDNAEIADEVSKMYLDNPKERENDKS